MAKEFDIDNAGESRKDFFIFCEADFGLSRLAWLCNSPRGEFSSILQDPH